MFSLKNKIVFITGASSGIGEACAEQFARLGCHLILTARRKDKLDVLAQRLVSEYGIKVLPIEMDVRDKHNVTNVISALTSEWKNIDVLVNNAGLALDSVPLQPGLSD